MYEVDYVSMVGLAAGAAPRSGRRLLANSLCVSGGCSLWEKAFLEPKGYLMKKHTLA